MQQPCGAVGWRCWLALLALLLALLARDATEQNSFAYMLCNSALPLAKGLTACN
jgi:uncharacterized integral membrane protein